MTTLIEGPAANVAEIAKRAGLTIDEVKVEAAALGLFVGLNWAHEAALATQDAFVLVDGSARRNLEHRAAWEAHSRALDAWQEARESVRRQAFNDAWEIALKASHGHPRATDAGHAAAREAVAEWDRANPEPVFAEPESRVRSWLRRAKAGTR